MTATKGAMLTMNTNETSTSILVSATWWRLKLLSTELDVSRHFIADLRRTTVTAVAADTTTNVTSGSVTLRSVLDTASSRPLYVTPSAVGTTYHVVSPLLFLATLTTVTFSGMAM